ncbi:MAG TPA: carboxypeptidase-like regulatory domain-containing protein [Bryobacteraceae bacterium]
MRTRFRIAVFVAMLGFACNAFAQAPTATLVGKVIDQTSANVVGATVAIRNTATNETRTARTELDGQYTVSNLAPATYDVTISMTGFRPLEEKNLELAADQTARLDANLQVGATTETVTVAADVGLLNTETSTKGDLITPAEVAEIPLNGRNFNDLAFTVAGVQPSEAGAKGASYVAGGSRADSSGVFIDGINDESPRDAGSQVNPPLDSLQEFKMETSDYTAQYGRLSGSVVNMVTKSGGNRYHGSLFDYIRNDLFDAEPFNFAAPPAPAKTKLRQNQFGADLSGPISIPHLYNGQDRTFFTLSIEMVRAVTGVISNTIVPTLLERSGDFSQSLGGNPYYFHNPLTNTKATCTATGGAGCLYPAPYDKIPTLDPVAQKLLAYYPKPNISNAPIGQNNFQIVTDKTTLSDNGLVRADQKLGAKDTITGLFLRNVSTGTNPTSGAPTGLFGDRTINHSSILALSETRIVTPNLVNDFHYGRTRTVSVQGANDAGTNFALQLGIAGTTTNPAFLGFPSFKPSGYASIGDGASDPVEFVVNDYDGSDLVTWIHGKHTFKFGSDIFHVQLFQPTNTDKNGAFTYNGKFTDTTTADALADMLAGYPATSLLMSGGIVNHLFQTNYAGFGMDDFKVAPNLTLNLGLRYEVQTLPSEENGQLSNFVPSLGQIVYTNSSSVSNISALLTQAGLTNYYVPASAVKYPAALIHVNPLRFGPRIGFAYRPFDNDRTVIRAGYGIFYTGIRLSVIRTNLTGQFPFAAQTTYTALNPTSSAVGSSLISSTNPFPAAGGALGGILTPNGYDPNAPSANLQSYNFTIEQDLGKGLGLEIAYVGSKGTHLGQETDYNQERIPNTASSRPFPAFQAITLEQFNGVSHYDSGQVTVRRRFEHGLFFRVNYTFAKSLDEQSGANAAGSNGYFANQNVLSPSAEYGRSDFDIRQNFTATSVYRTSSRLYALRDWQGSGNILAYSGQPLTLKVSGTQDLGVATRPNQICNGVLSGSTRNISEWFNPSCYAVPATGFGNVGRNTISAPGSVVLNLAVGRVFTMPRELGSFEFRLEAFNALNHPNFASPSNTIGSSTTAGVISSTTGNQRLVQISGRYSF